MKSILVPIDFNQGALNAFKYALDLADTLKAHVTLFHVHEPGQDTTDLPPLLAEAFKKKDKPMAWSALKQYGESVQKEMAIQIDANYVIREGSPVKSIIAFAKSMHADLIIMSTWWAKGINGLLAPRIGNIATKVAEQTKKPVLLIPEKAQFQGVEHIVYATNFREKDQRIPKELIRLRKSADLAISVVHVHRSGTLYGPIEFEFLNNMYRMEKGNINIFFYTIHHQKVIEGLNKFIEKENGDILAILMHENLSVIDRLLGSDIPHQMAFQSKIPLLILHKDYEANS